MLYSWWALWWAVLKYSCLETLRNLSVLPLVGPLGGLFQNTSLETWSNLSVVTLVGFLVGCFKKLV
jgi:hypothetical protein